MSLLLSKAGTNITVQQLLDALQEVLDFEASITKKYAISVRSPLRRLDTCLISAQVQDILKATQATGAARLHKAITSAFEPHMGVFISAQDKALSDMLSKYRGSKSRSSLEASASNRSSTEDDSTAPALVLPSSTELFYFYAQNLDQCAKLFSGQPLYDLCQLHKKWLKIYAEDVLVASMKK